MMKKLLILISCVFILSGYTAVHAEVEPLVLPDDGPLDNGGYWEDWGDDYYYYMDDYGAYYEDDNGYFSYDDLTGESDAGSWGSDGYVWWDESTWDAGADYLTDVAYDQLPLGADAVYDFSILGEEGDLLEQGLPEATSDTFSEDIQAHINEMLNSSEADDAHPIYGEESVRLEMMDLPLARIERDAVAISGVTDKDEVIKIIEDMAAADGLDPDYVYFDEKVILWDQLDNILMGSPFSSNEIAYSVEEAYMNGDISLDTKTSIGEMIAEKPPEERFDFKGRVAEVQFGLGKPWDKGVYEKDGRLTHEYEVAFPNTGDSAGYYSPYLDTVIYSDADLDMRVRGKEELYDTLQAAHGIVIPEFEKARSEGRLREIEGAGVRRHERDHVGNETEYVARYSDMTTSDFFDGDAQRVDQTLSKVRELEAYYAALEESEYPQMDLMYLEYAREIDKRNAAAQSPNMDYPFAKTSASIVGNEFARKYLTTDVLKASKFPEYMANYEASVLGDGYVTELESDITRQKIEDGSYLQDPEYFVERMLWMSTLPADQLRTRFKNTHDELAAEIMPELPPRDDNRY